ncbi:MAG: hypothetical protein HPZ91_19640 [Lentisphaeria bacterium]|nr:hypothetical protein [Lentisphaeria bacterium]
MKSVYGIAAALFLLAGLAAGEAVLDRTDVERLLYLQQGNGGIFLVFQEKNDDGTLFCTRLGSEVSGNYRTQDLQILPFRRNVSPDTVAVYAAAQMGGLYPGQACIELCRYYPSAGGEKLLLADAEMKSLFASLRELAAGWRQITRANLSDEAVTAEISNALEQSQPVTVIRSAVQEKDFFLALSIHDSFSRQLLALSRNSFYGSDAITRQINDFLAGLRTELFTTYQEQRKLVSSVRESNFRKLLPGVFGEWNGVPADFNQLQRLYTQSFRSYCNLDVYSPNAEFPQWGSAMLDVLALLPDSPAAEPLGQEFDRAFNRYSDLVKRKAEETQKRK